MSNKLKQAFNEASKLSADDQDAFAAFLLAELKDESEWQERYAASEAQLSILAKEARNEFEAGKTEPLDKLLD